MREGRESGHSVGASRQITPADNPPADKEYAFMCLGIPGKVVNTYHEHEVLMGKISFGGVSKQVCLEHVPEVKVGEYVIVHVGFALSKIDEQEARQVFEFLEHMNDLDELEQGEPFASDGAEDATGDRTAEAAPPPRASGDLATGGRTPPLSMAESEAPSQAPSQAQGRPSP